MKKHLKDFLFAFCWSITCEVILADLGWSFEKNQWEKYLTAVVFGLAWTFYFQKQIQKARQEAQKQRS